MRILAYKDRYPRPPHQFLSIVIVLFSHRKLASCVLGTFSRVLGVEVIQTFVQITGIVGWKIVRDSMLYIAISRVSGVIGVIHHFKIPESSKCRT